MKLSSLFLACMASLAAAVIFFAHSHRWLIIRLPTTLAPRFLQDTRKKLCTITYWKNNCWVHETVSCLWETDETINAYHLLQSYCTLLAQEELIPHTVTVQTAALNAQRSELFLSFSHNPFTAQISTYTKWILLEGFLTTIKAAFPDITAVRFLAEHAPLHDPHLDFTRPWPIEGFLTTEQPPLSKITSRIENSHYTLIMLDPAGDARTPGRTIGDTFERAVTYELAQQVKKHIEENTLNVKVVIARTPGQTIDFLQNASAANRTQAHLFIHLSCYQSHKQLPSIHFYNCLYHPTTDIWYRTSNTLSFEPYYNAHLTSARISKECAQRCMSSLALIKPLPAIIHNLYGVPYKPLLGITRPAFCIEVGCADQTQCTALAPYLAQSIITAVIGT